MEDVARAHLIRWFCQSLAPPPGRISLCRQVSIENPGTTLKDCVSILDVPVPDVPPNGARIRVEYVGVCYRMQKAQSQFSDADVANLSGGESTQASGEGSGSGTVEQSLAQLGVRDAALFPGYEVAGIVEFLGTEVPFTSLIGVGDRVVVYPFEGVPNGYAEFMTVPDLQYLVKVPDSMHLSVAAMLPTGALWAMNAVQVAQNHILKRLEEQGDTGRVRVLVVGTGGLALWALRLFEYYLKDVKDRVLLVVACLRDEGILLAKEAAKVFDVVRWNEECYERILIDRTKDCCEGEVDVVMDFGTTSRSLHRSLQCLSKGGITLMSFEASEHIVQKLNKDAEECEQTIKTVEVGTLEQFTELVGLVASGEITPPPHTVYPMEQAREVIRKLCNAEVHGRAVLSFGRVD